MTPKRIGTAILAASLTLSPAGPVLAGGGDVVGGIIGGIIGGAIVSESQRNRTRRSGTRAPSPARAEAREVQTSLNYFGFPAGTPDGVLGRQSRSAISSYQVHMGYPVTGQLTQYEKSFLLSSYHRAIAGGAVTNQQIAANPQGPRGLLIMYRDELAGQAQPAPAAPTTTVVVNPAPAAPAAGTTTTTTVATPAAPSNGGLPTFMASGAQTGSQASLASHCNKVSLLTNSNGGFVTLASMNDPAMVLNEQFCLARTYAIAEGEELAGNINGVTPAQISAQCEGFGPAMKPHVASLSLKPMGAVVQDVSAFVLQSGMSPAQLVDTAKVCLSVGYRTDNMDVAVGSSLLLFALGEQVYGELMGHHLTHGFGTTQRNDLAQDWYLASVNAVDSGAPAVFAPGQPDRSQLIRAAVTGQAPAAPMTAPAPASAPVPALPSFNVNN